MTLRLIGAGVGRTGTLSLKLALEQLLGEPCYHMMKVIERPDDAGVWADALNGTHPDWVLFFESFGAAVDWPACAFWQELSEAFPDAPILLSTRDPDAWWTSANATIFEGTKRRFGDTLGELNEWTSMVQALFAQFSPDWTDETAAKAAFVAHNENVRRLAPPDRLVEWQPGDGWVPLCDALGVPIPDEPFPHANTTEEFRKMTGLDQPAQP